MTISTPTLPRAKAAYLRGGMDEVTGWLNPSTAVYLAGLEVLQRAAEVTGDVVEIGIHHGKSFLALALDLPADQRAVAIDVFEDRAANVDGSGRGDRAVFEQNLATHGAGRNVEIVQSSSLDLAEQGFVTAGRRFRIFSIDGGHTAEITRNDLWLAEHTVIERGLVVLDDVLNRHWTGVITGLFHYWAEGGALVPVALVPNKLLLATSVDEAKAYRALLDEHFRPGLEKADVPLGGHVVDVYGEMPWLVPDDEGGAGPVGGGRRDATGRGRMVAVPESHLAELENQLRLHQLPLHRKAARRMPWLAARVRPLVRVARRVRPDRSR